MNNSAHDERRCCVRQNRVVLASVADVKLSGGEAGPTGRDLAVNPFSDGDNTNSSPGRARHKPSNHCAGNAGLPPLNLYTRVRIPLCNLAHETGVQRAPAFPAPSSIEGQRRCKARANHATRTRSHDHAIPPTWSRTSERRERRSGIHTPRPSLFCELGDGFRSTIQAGGLGSRLSPR